FFDFFDFLSVFSSITFMLFCRVSSDKFAASSSSAYFSNKGGCLTDDKLSIYFCAAWLATLISPSPSVFCLGLQGCLPSNSSLRSNMAELLSRLPDGTPYSTFHLSSVR